MLVCLLLVIGAYLFSPLLTGLAESKRQEDVGLHSDGSEQPAKAELIIIMTEKKASSLLNSAIDKELPVEDLSVSFGGGIIVVRGSALRDVILPSDLLLKYPNLWVIKSFIPEVSEFSVSLAVNVVNGELKIDPKSFALGNYQIPTGFLPEEICDAVCGMISENYISESFVLRSVEVEQGTITVAMD